MKYDRLIQMLDERSLYEIKIPTEIVVYDNGDREVLCKSVYMTKGEYKELVESEEDMFKPVSADEKKDRSDEYNKIVMNKVAAATGGRMPEVGDYFIYTKSSKYYIEVCKITIIYPNTTFAFSHDNWTVYKHDNGRPDMYRQKYVATVGWQTFLDMLKNNFISKYYPKDKRDEMVADLKRMYPGLEVPDEV